VCPQVDLEEAALHPPARVVELKVAVRQEGQPTAAGAILDPKLPGAEVALGDPSTKGDRPWAKQRQDVGPDRRNGQAVFDEKLARAVQAPTVGRRVVGARSLVEKAQTALGERIKERTPSTNDPRDGALNPLDDPPEPELVETVVGAGGGSLVRASGGKEGKIDQIEGEVPVEVNGSEDLPIPRGQEDGDPIVKIVVRGDKANEVIAKDHVVTSGIQQLLPSRESGGGGEIGHAGA